MSFFLLTKSLILAVLFSTPVGTAVVPKLVILFISFSTLFILALRVVLVANLVIRGILFSMSLI